MLLEHLQNLCPSGLSKVALARYSFSCFNNIALKHLLSCWQCHWNKEKLILTQCDSSKQCGINNLFYFGLVRETINDKKNFGEV